MDSDDDYESFSPQEESSPQSQNKLKRLKKKKAADVPSNSSPSPVSIDPLTGLPRVDFAQLMALEDAAAEAVNAHLDDGSNESLPSQIEIQMESQENDSLDDMGFGDDVPFEVNRKETKRALEFGGLADIEVDGDLGRTEKKRTIEVDLSDKKDDEMEDNIANKKKRNKRIKSDEMKSNPSASDKRRQEKERKAYLKQLHAESQRLLRETREAAFKPVPVVNKPISSVLEKIRQRKLELSKRKALQDGNNFITTEKSGGLRDDMMGFEPRSRLMEQRKDELAKPVEMDTLADPEDFVGRDALDLDKCTKSPVPPSSEKVPTDESPSEASPPKFRAPVNDTEDLFANLESQDGIDELLGDLQDSSLKEVPKPSLLAMNLKFDSAPYEDSSSEEDNDKENIDPVLHRGEDNSTFPRGAPAEAFLDDEAEEDDDSDALVHFKENEEEEDMEDSEEFNDIIATDYAEKPVDHDRRNELHQMWLQQQDAAGTDNLLQKLKIGSKPNEDFLLGVEQEVDEDEEEYNHDDVVPKKFSRMNSKRAKELITQMFVDKDDSFLSDEDEEIEKIRVKQQLLIRAEGQATVISPVEDESSREVFGLIKKLNIVPENKKKVKASSYFDSVLKGGNNKSFSKPSFLGRLPNHLPSTHKQGSGVARSFIFGRDDSNSRSSISMSDDSLDAISKENQPIRTSAATLASSQVKFMSQYKNNTSAVGASSASLFEILKRASIQSMNSNNGDPVDLTHVLSTFKVPKNQIKVDGRN